MLVVITWLSGRDAGRVPAAAAGFARRNVQSRVRCEHAQPRDLAD